MSGIVEILRGSLFALAHFCGGSFGAAILLASAAMRIALVPITFSATRRRLIQERKLREIAPQTEALKKRYAKKPEEFAVALQKLRADNGLELFDRKSVLSGSAATSDSRTCNPRCCNSSARFVSPARSCASPRYS